jgi:hypothetical protein
VNTADKPASESQSGAEPSRSEGWLLAFASALTGLSGRGAGSAAGTSHTETATILRLAREVAHGVERRLAPLAAYLTGRFVAERLTQGATVEEALAEAEAAARRLISHGEGRP